MGLMDMLKTSDPMAKFYAAAEKSNVPQGGVTGKLFSAMFPHGLGNLAFGREPEPMPPLETPEGTALMADLASNMMVPGTFIGPKGLARLFGDDAAKGILATAESKLAQGVPKEAVFQELGVFKGPEGKWRYEIDDSARAVNDYPFSPMDAYKSRREDAWIREEDMAPVNAMKPYTDKTTQELIDEYKRTGGEIVDAAQADNMDLARKLMDDRAGLDGLLSAMADRRYGPASTYMAHDDLYAAYPDFKDMHIRKDDYLDARGQYHQGDHTRGEQIELRGYPRMDKGSTLLHELQHAVQEREGFARGGSPASMADEIGGARLRADELRQKMEIAKNVIADEARWVLADPSKKDFVRKATDRWQSRLGKLGDDNPYGVDERMAVQFELEEADDTLRRWAQEYNDARNQAMNDPMDMYQRLAGEAEARAVQDRMNMSMDERRALFPEYAGRNDLIVRGLMSGGK